jgi:enediyne biosynthesis protein E4
MVGVSFHGAVRAPLLHTFLFTLLATWPQASDVAIRLVDVAEQAGITLLNICGGASKDYILEVNGNGAAFFDYDNDGDVDVLIVNGSTLPQMKRGGDQMVALFRNDGKGHFADVTPASRLSARGWGMGTCIADYDNDGFQDAYITAFGPNLLVHNNGDGTFTDVTARAGVGDPRWSTNCAFADYDRDGDLDLYVANYLAFSELTVPKRGASPNCKYLGIDVMCGPRDLVGEPDVLYRNNGDRTFTDVTRSAGIVDPGYYGFGVLFSDLDADGWPDIFVANDSVPNLLFRNNHDGTFSDIGLPSGLALSGDGKAQASMGVDAADYDGDGRLDVFVTNFSHDYNTLYQHSADGFFSDVSYKAGVAAPSLSFLGWGAGFADFDNDGLLDIFVANGHVYPQIDQFGVGTKYLQRKQLFKNLGAGRFRDISDEVAGGLLIDKSSRGAAFGDIDNDGDVDVLVINMNDRPTLLRNETTASNNWVALKLVGKSGNRDAIGARVALEQEGPVQVSEIRSGGSYLSHNDMRVHFGLGARTKVPPVQVRWPDGAVEWFDTLTPNDIHVIRQGQGRSSASRFR